MNRKTFLLSTIAGSVTVSTGALNSAQAEPSMPLSVSILANEILPPRPTFSPEPTRFLSMPARYPHIVVAIRNESSAPIRIWTDGCSMGCYNLTFELLGVEDKPLPKPVRLSRGSLGFGGNVPDYTLLAPGEMALREAELAQGPEPPNGRIGWMYWDFPRIPEGSGVHVRLRAVYEIPANADTRAHQVWTGRIVSPTYRYLCQLT